VQTLSRLNRAHPGKDTTYILDFVNEPPTSWPPSRPITRRPNWRRRDRPEPGLRPARQAGCAGHYDDNEVDRVVKVELNPKASQ
jgi:type I restriction enzyme R subunit